MTCAWREKKELGQSTGSSDPWTETKVGWAGVSGRGDRRALLWEGKEGPTSGAVLRRTFPRDPVAAGRSPGQRWWLCPGQVAGVLGRQRWEMRGEWQGRPPNSRPGYLEGWGHQDSESEMPEAPGGRRGAVCSPVPGPALGHTLWAWLQGPGRPPGMLSALLFSRPGQRGCIVAWTSVSSTQRSRSGTSMTPP